MKQALIIGSNGQDGRLLKDLLVSRGYVVTGLSRAALEHHDGRRLPAIALNAPSAVNAVVQESQPDEIYYLAAFHHSSQQTHSLLPHELWTASMDINATGPGMFLEAVRRHAPRARFFYAGSSLAFGAPEHSPQNEDTCLRPQCVYGISKTAGIHALAHYRDTHGIFASAAILFNHESHLRPTHFLSRKIINGAWRIRHGLANELVVADLNAKADWGYAPDFVDAFWRILQADAPRDYVVATGQLHSVREWVEHAFGYAGLDWDKYVREDSGLASRKRPVLLGDSSRLERDCGWTPVTPFGLMTRLMYDKENGA